MKTILFRICINGLNFVKRSKLGTTFILKTNMLKKEINNNKLFRKGLILKHGVLTYSISLFGLFKNEELPEDKLIHTIKLSILSIQREEYDKAEQMLHLALRMAQDLQNKDGITYVYDVMANLAMEREQYKKAEKLFTDVMRRLLADGISFESPKLLHISSKLAHIAQLQGDLVKAKMGFIWTLSKIEECIKKMPDDINIKELCALTTNWFGQVLMEENNFKQAKQCFKDAYDCFIEIHGDTNEEAITILNNLGVVSTNMGHFEEGKRYILKALCIARSTNNTTQEAILLANLGLNYLQEGLINEAKTYCSQAWKIGNIQHHDVTIKQAEYCLQEIKKNT